MWCTPDTEVTPSAARPATTNAAPARMSVAFTGGNAATLTYTVDGVSVSKAIARQVFGIPATQCEADD